MSAFADFYIYIIRKTFTLPIDSVTMLCYNINVTLLHYLILCKKGEASILDFKEKELISKKDLLTRYGISYGALYRWKRKGLIPEEWFIKKSTVTGQETFFPAALVCQRVELILNQKEDVLLDELADKLNEEEKSNTSIVLQTVFGNKNIQVKDIKRIYFDVNGEQTDVTEKIIELISKFEKK